jgi:hypothetical protein
MSFLSAAIPIPIPIPMETREKTAVNQRQEELDRAPQPHDRRPCLFQAHCV